jgi:mannosyltransferase
MMGQAIAQRRMFLLTLGILVAFALRVYRLDAPALRGDEAFSVLFARNSIGEMLGLLNASTEPHPPFSFVALHYWARWAGESEFALRYTSLCAGVLAVPLIYVLGRLLWDRQIGLMAAALLAINPFYIWHAQEARMYGMVAAFCLASVVLFLTLLRRRGWGWWLAYGLVTALSLYTHYYAVLIVAFQGAYLVLELASRRRRKAIRDDGERAGEARQLFGRWLAGLTVAGAFYLPWIWFSWRILTAYHGSARSDIPFFQPIYRCLLVFGQGQTLPAKAALWFLPLWGGLFAGGWFVAWRRDRRSAGFMALYLLIPWVAVFFDSLQRPAFDERYFMVSTPPYYLALALALASLSRWRRILGGLALAGVVGVSGASLYHHYYDPAFARAPDWRSLNQFFVERVRPGDVVIANYPDPAIRYYYQFDVPWIVLPESYPVDRQVVAGRLDSFAQAHSRIWFTPQPSPSWDADGVVQEWLEAHTEFITEDQVGTFRVRLYHTPRQFESEIVPLDVRLGGNIQLLGYVLRDREGTARDRLELGAGDQVRLTLYWRAESSVDKNYVVFTHLLDSTGWLRGQQDNQPREGTFPTRAWVPGAWIVDVYRITVPPDAPSGEGLLEIGMYDPESGVRLQVSGQDADSEHQRVLLSDVVSVR